MLGLSLSIPQDTAAQLMLTCPSDVQAMKGVIQNLLFITPKRQLLFVTDVDGHPPNPSFMFEVSQAN